METILFWVYLLNAILLINHEIDSAYWKEWNLFGLKGGINLFLLIHFPLLFIVLFGFILVYQRTFWGYIISIFLGICGLAALIIHAYFIKRGRKEFNTPISLSIIYLLGFTSLIQLTITINILSSWYLLKKRLDMLLFF